MNCSKAYKKKVFFASSLSVILLFCFVLWTSNVEEKIIDDSEENENYADENFGDFLIDGENCKIPNLNPNSKTVMKFYKQLKYKKCSELEPLTYIKQNENLNNLLMIDEEQEEKYLSWHQNKIQCCYQAISRSGSGKDADEKFSLSECFNFDSGHVLNHEEEFIIVRCKAFLDNFMLRAFKSEIYSDAHAVVIPKPKAYEKLQKQKSQKGRSVLLIGIDSVSRLNFIRAMPETHKFVKDGGWYEMKGFNKIGDNTYPNLNAILNGRNVSQLQIDCDYKKVGELEKCQYLWNDFNDANYITAYAEDATEIQTFNYYHTGFIHPPTDHYMRPFTLAAEKNVKRTLSKPWLIKCLGYRHYADYIYQYAIDFANLYKNSSSFGLFWTNSISHDELNLPSEYDIKMRFYLEELQRLQILNDSIVIFFSDHGMRFGEIRDHFTGWLEDRLPFLYIWLPENFKLEHPELAENLRINQERLVSPFDLYITIKHILNLSGGHVKDLTAISCPSCQSLFHEVPSNRSCLDAGIDEHYCTCTNFQEVESSSPNVRKVLDFTIEELNSQLSKYEKCAKLKLHKILSARESGDQSSKIKSLGVKDFLISFEVLPSYGRMEATVRCHNSNCDKNLQIIGEISRINKYGDQSKCISDAHLRKYCYCV